MEKRLELQQKFQNIIGVRTDGKQNVLFQPPESVKLVYPCIIYKRSSGDTKYADDMPRFFTNSYDVLVIDKDPDSKLVKKLVFAFPMIRHTRFYVADNMNHDAFVLYY